MSLDPTLKVSGGLMRSRNVLTRAERIARMMEEGNFDPHSDSPLGLPKLRVRQSKAGTKSKKEEKPDEEAVEATEGAEAEAQAAAQE